MTFEGVRGFTGLYQKEVAELFREKRLGILLIAVGFFLALPYSFLLREFVRFGYSMSYGETLYPIVYIGPITLLVLSLTFAADAISKEKDSGMIGLFLSSPVTLIGLFLAKVAAAFTAYVLFSAFVLAVLATLTLPFGVVILKLGILIVLIPFAAFFVFLVGVALVASVLTKTSKGAVGLSLAIYIPMFFLMQEPPGLGLLLREYAPRFYDILAYNPMGAATSAADKMLYGVVFDPVPLVATLVVGFGLIVTAYVLLARQEVTG